VSERAAGLNEKEKEHMAGENKSKSVRKKKTNEKKPQTGEEKRFFVGIAWKRATSLGGGGKETPTKRATKPKPKRKEGGKTQNSRYTSETKKTQSRMKVLQRKKKGWYGAGGRPPGNGGDGGTTEGRKKNLVAKGGGRKVN